MIASSFSFDNVPSLKKKKKLFQIHLTSLNFYSAIWRVMVLSLIVSKIISKVLLHCNQTVTLLLFPFCVCHAPRYQRGESFGPTPLKSAPVCKHARPSAEQESFSLSSGKKNVRKWHRIQRVFHSPEVEEMMWFTFLLHCAAKKQNVGRRSEKHV